MGSEECETPYVSTLADTLCGTDGQSYYNKAALECRVKNVDKNLRLNKHEGRCWSFENYHHEIVLALLALGFCIFVVALCWCVCSKAKRAIWKKNKPFLNVSSA